MHKVSQSVIKKDHAAKIEGRSVYVSDYTAARDGRPILTGKLLRSEKARARILSVTLPPLPEGYMYVDARDVPGRNTIPMVSENSDLSKDDTPVFCADTVEYAGDPIGMIVGPDAGEVARLVAQTKIAYEELEPVLDFRKAEHFLSAYEIGYGDTEKAFAEADHIFEEEFETGYQEHAYLETQGMMAEPEPDGGLFVHGSAQGTYDVRNALLRTLNRGPEAVHFMQDVTGGGFGGKETFPSILACQVAVAALKAQAPVRCVLDRREDMAYTNKRHPSFYHIKMAVKDGRVTAVDSDFVLNGGAYATISSAVLLRAMFCATGVYTFPSVHVRGKTAKTNTPPCDAFRGFGGPQSQFAMERMMDHVAQRLGIDEIEFKKAHLAQKGDRTVTQGTHHFPVPLAAMIDQVDAACGLREKREAYSRPQTGRYRRGIGLSLVLHGAGLNGIGVEANIIKPRVALHKYADGTVEVLASSSDIGQGVRTTFPKIVAYELGIPLERVFFNPPDTARVPDSGPTNASRSLMVVGELLRRAAIRLREAWQDGQEQEITEGYKDPAYVKPMDMSTYTGDAYPVYSWMAAAIEVEVDTLTGLTRILHATGCFDVGTPMDYNIVMGQMEGGFLQGIGYASTEKMDCDARGRIVNDTFSEYLVPTATDVPDIKALLHVEPYPDGAYGAKGAGELPLVGAAPAYVAAVEQALGAGRHPLNHIPFTAEDTLKEIMKEGAKAHGAQ